MKSVKVDLSNISEQMGLFGGRLKISPEVFRRINQVINQSDANLIKGLSFLPSNYTLLVTKIEDLQQKKSRISNVPTT